MAEKKKKEQRKEQKEEPIKEKPEQKSEDYRSDVIKTLVPLSLGSIAGIISYYTTIGASRDPIGIIILVMFIYLNKFILPKMSVELKGKDWIVISFLSFTTWYIFWTILLNL